MGGGPGGKRGPGKLVHIQGAPPSSSAEVHPDEEQVGLKGQEACMDERGAPGPTESKEGGLERVEAGTGSLGGLQRGCASG